MPNAHYRRPRVLIAGASTRAMAESAAQAGYDVTSLDAFGDLDQHPDVRAFSLPRDFGVEFGVEAVADVARSIETDAVAYLSPFENHPATVARLSTGRALWGNDAATLGRARDPAVLPMGTGDTGSARWLLKPRASGGGHGIRWWTPGEPIPSGWHVQRFVEGVPGSIIFVAAAGRIAPVGLTRQLVGEAAFGAVGFRYCGSILDGVDDTHFVSDAALLASAEGVAAGISAALGLVGVNCIDVVARDGRAYPIEINPRWSASMELVERSYALSVFGAHAEACTTGAVPSLDLARARADAGASGKAIVFARHDVTCGDTRSWLDDATVRDVPHPGERIPAGRPVCTVFARGVTSADCHARLVERAGRIYETIDAWASVPV